MEQSLYSLYLPSRFIKVEPQIHFEEFEETLDSKAREFLGYWRVKEVLGLSFPT